MNKIYIESDKDELRGAATDRRHPWGRTIFSTSGCVFIDGKYVADIKDGQIMYFHYKGDLIDHFLLEDTNVSHELGYTSFKTCDACIEEFDPFNVFDDLEDIPF